MRVCDVLENPNFDAEFEWRLNLVNDECEVTKIYESVNNDEIPFDIMVKQICYMTIGSCFIEGHNSNVPCLVIEVNT